MAVNADSSYVTPAQKRQRVFQIIANRDATITTDEARMLANAVISGDRTFDDVRGIVEGTTFKREVSDPRFGTSTNEYTGGSLYGGGGSWAGASPGGGGTGVPPPAQKTVDFYAMTRALFPWLPEALIRAYADGWSAYGDPTVALGVMRQSDAYDRYFPGNRRADDTFRMTEQEYMATKDGYRQTLRDYGVNPDVFADRFVSLIEGDVSLQEFNQRLDAVNAGLVNNLPAIQQAYAQYWGLSDLTPQSIFAMAIDPDIGRAVLDRKISVAQIGGEAAARGFSRSVGEAGRLASAGITQTQARSLYSQAEDQLGTLDALARRWRDRDQTVELDEFEDAFALGDAGQMRRFRRNVAAERSSFTGQQGRVERDQSGGLSGLRSY